MKRTEHVYLMIDDSIIEDRNNLRLELGPVEKSPENPLFGADFSSDPPRKWEPRYDNLYPSVIYDDKEAIYKIWYNGFIREEASEKTPLHMRPDTEYFRGYREDGLMYAYSRDGLEWTKPNLDLRHFDGTTHNNIVMDVNSHGIHGVGVFKDAKESDDGRRYKALLLDAENKKMAVAFSEDGLQWSPPIHWPEHDEIGDAHPNAIRSADGYIGFMRGNKGEGINRVVMRTTSDDFIHWSKPTMVLEGANLHDQIYSMPVFHHRGIYLGFPAIFHGGDAGAADWDLVDTELAMSSDSITWTRVAPGEPFIPRGSGSYPKGAYDCGCVYSGVPLLVGDTHRIYYGGSNGPHSGFREGFLCLATLPKDRFAGLTVENHRVKGTVVTGTIELNGSSITVNTEIVGSLRGGIMSPSGKFIQGFAMEDCVALRNGGLSVSLEWKRSIEEIRGRKTRLVFELQDATIYGFSCVG